MYQDIPHQATFLKQDFITLSKRLETRKNFASSFIEIQQFMTKLRHFE
jgi:hypothetical protein